MHVPNYSGPEWSEVIVPASWKKSVANVLRLSPQSQARWGLLWMSFSLYDFTILSSNNWEITSWERDKRQKHVYYTNKPWSDHIEMHAEYETMIFFTWHLFNQYDAVLVWDYQGTACSVFDLRLGDAALQWQLTRITFLSCRWVAGMKHIAWSWNRLWCSARANP